MRERAGWVAREVVTTDEPEAPPGDWYLKYSDEIFNSTDRARRV